MASTNTTTFHPIATFTVAVGDRSGSMCSYGRSGVAGQYYEQLRLLWETANKDTTPTYYTLISFDGTAETFINQLRLDGLSEKDLPNLNSFCEALCPRGSTRLYDTALEGLVLLKKQVEDFKKELPRMVSCLDPIIATQFVLNTDGMDNVSSIGSQERMRREIELAQERGTVTIFLGANMNAARAGASMGFKKETTVQMGSDQMSASKCLRAVSNTVARAMTGGNTQIDLSDDSDDGSSAPVNWSPVPQLPGLNSFLPPPPLRRY